MRVDQLLLTLHILAAATWIGAALALQVISGRMASSAGAVVDQFALDAETIGKLIFGPSAVVLAVTGVALVAHESLSWGRLWIVLGIAALATAGTVGGTFLIPEGRRLAALAKEPDHNLEELRQRTRRRFLVARIDLLVLVMAVADMVFRPGR
jgi:hypothetical protein